jgi:DNA sulfur modification protein DndB
MSVDSRFGYVLPAIRGVQAGREYYASMCPLRYVSRMFLFDEEEAALAPELRAQRFLNKGRVPEMARYLLDNKQSYVFSALTASINGDVQFEPFGDTGDSSQIGSLRVPMDARFIINDGQHRRAAIEMALRENPDLGDESIAVVFFIDRGLERCQQMFADLNRHAIRPSRSLGVLYDHRDDKARLARLVVLKSSVFKGLVEMERSSLSLRSNKLFTLSAIFSANSELLDGLELRSVDEAAELAIEYWGTVARQIPEWEMVRGHKTSAGAVRKAFIHSHGIALQVFGLVGNALLRESRTGWKKRLKPLGTIDWSRSNTRLWEGTALLGGRVSKANQNVVLTTVVVKKRLKIALSPEERRLESAHRRDRNGKVKK